MNLQSGSEDQQRIAITLEIVPEDQQDADPALIDAVGRDAIDSLRKEGYTVKPIPTEKRGGDLLVQIIKDVWTYKDTLDITGTLITIFTPLVLIAKHVLEAHKKRSGKDGTGPYKLMIKLDGAPISAEAPSLEGVKDLLELAREFQETYPIVAANLTPQSKVEIKYSVPKRQRRPRRRH